MSAGGALQTAIAGALNAIAGLTGVFDGPPARASFPYSTIDAATESDWSHKSGDGREVMVGSRGGTTSRYACTGSRTWSRRACRRCPRSPAGSW